MNDLIRISLATHIVPGLPSVPTKAFRQLMKQDLPDVDDLLRWSEQNFKPETALAIRARLESMERFEYAIDQWQDVGGWTLCENDDAFPTAWRIRFGDACPPVVFGRGNASLLQSKAIGFAGSRSATPTILEATKRLAAEAVSQDFAVVSGGARGVDLAALEGAWSARGSAIAVVADRLDRFGQGSDLPDDDWCALTPFAPNMGFTVANAMGRNRLIYGLCEGAIIMACEEGSGGTWAGAVEALRLKIGEVGYYTGPDASEANAKLAKLGAVPVQKVQDLHDVRTAQANLFS
jgi:predicted Rossmann fold nucleotide-binding protein DprA/Smf involved in DNA uptake